MNNNFTYGIQSKLPEAVAEGQVKVTTDTHSLYFDLDGKRVRITDFETVETVEDLDNILAPSDNFFYYVKEENSVYKYTNSGWKKLFDDHFENLDIHVSKEKQEKWDNVASHIWIGTKEEYETAKSNNEIAEGVFPIVTDATDSDESSDGESYTDEEIHNAVEELLSTPFYMRDELISQYA